MRLRYPPARTFTVEFVALESKSPISRWDILSVICVENYSSIFQFSVVQKYVIHLVQ